MSAPDRIAATGKGDGGAMRRLLFVLPALAFLGLLFFFFSGLQRDPTVLPSAMIDKPVPTFDLPALLPDRPALSSADFGKGQGVVLVNFFASWCVPCRVEHPILAGLAASGQVKIDGIVYKDKPEAAAKFLTDGGNPYSRIGVDASGRTAIDFGVYGVPETYIVDKSGRIRYRHAGPLTDEVLQQEVLPRIQALQAQ